MIKNSITYENLVKDFAERNIPITSPGFYDHPKFLLVEEKNASYLDNYAKFVHDRPRDASYDNFVQQTVPLVAEVYHKKLIEHGDPKANLSMPSLMSKALEELGIWNYVVKGSVTLDFPSASNLDTRYFWSVDNRSFTTAHTWLVAPPFYVVDITLKLQTLSEEESEHLTPIICSEANDIIQPEVEDVISPDACEKLKSHSLPRSEYFAVISPQTEKFINIIPSREVFSEETKIKFIPVAVSIPDLPFKQMTSIKFDGQTAYEIYENEIKGLIE